MSGVGALGGVDPRQWSLWTAQLDWGTGAWLGWAFGSPTLIDALRLRIAVHRGAKSPLLPSAEAEVGVEVLHLDSAADLEPTLLTLLAPPPPALQLRWVRCGRRTGEALRAWRELHMRLNERRHFLMQNNPGGVIFAGPAGLLGATRAAAPDLWTVRSVAVELEEERGTAGPTDSLLHAVVEADARGEPEAPLFGCLTLAVSALWREDGAAAVDWFTEVERRLVQQPLDGPNPPWVVGLRATFQAEQARRIGDPHAERAAYEAALSSGAIEGEPAVLLRCRSAAAALRAGAPDAVELARAAVDLLQGLRPLAAVVGLPPGMALNVWLDVVLDLAAHLEALAPDAARAGAALLVRDGRALAELPGQGAEGLRFALMGALIEAAVVAVDRGVNDVDAVLVTLDQLRAEGAGHAELADVVVGAAIFAAKLDPSAARVALVRAALQRRPSAGLSVQLPPLWALIGLTTVYSSAIEASGDDEGPVYEALAMFADWEHTLLAALRAAQAPPVWADLGELLLGLAAVVRALRGEGAADAHRLPSGPWVWWALSAQLGVLLTMEQIDAEIALLEEEDRELWLHAREDLLRELAARPDP
ncbi:MAG: hypothetical protein JNM72_05700 [Deltaproteobacteria bacterium]|nr:hypothetical protein [Deltaproteobacteria bacterium]